MKRDDDSASRRQLFRAIAVGAASIPLLALGGKNANGLGSLGWLNNKNGKNSGNGCCCLLKGTKVATSAGERSVEDLQVGDVVLTLSGPKAVKWIGYNKYTKDYDRPWQLRIMPIRIARGAIGDLMPHTDLYLSPEHCVFYNGALIPVRYLVNGVSIAPGMPASMAAIEYYHVEIDTHQVIFAEGAQVESFREESSEREYFSNFVQYERLYGRERRHRMAPFAPVLGYRSRREKAAGLARSIVSRMAGVRDPIQVARDQLAKRAEAMLV